MDQTTARKSEQCIFCLLIFYFYLPLKEVLDRNMNKECLFHYMLIYIFFLLPKYHECMSFEILSLSTSLFVLQLSIPQVIKHWKSILWHWSLSSHSHIHTQEHSWGLVTHSMALGDESWTLDRTNGNTCFNGLVIGGPTTMVFLENHVQSQQSQLQNIDLIFNVSLNWIQVCESICI